MYLGRPSIVGFNNYFWLLYSPVPYHSSQTGQGQCASIRLAFNVFVLCLLMAGAVRGFQKRIVAMQPT
jgi:hypothetical protein